LVILGIESSCDETGVALYDSERGAQNPAAGLLAQALYSQISMHRDYGGVVPELASRDHIRRVLPLTRTVLADARRRVDEIDAVAYTRGPGLAGALLVGASVAEALAQALGKPAIGIHHLEGHLFSPLLSADPPSFPFVALLVSGGHTQLMRVDGPQTFHLLGESLDDAAGEAFDKSAKLMGLGYPGGPALAKLATQGTPGRYVLPRPMLKSGNLDFSFSGLKTAVLTITKSWPENAPQQDGLDSDALITPDMTTRADLAHAVEAAIIEVLCAKAMAALEATGLNTLVVAGGVSANLRLRALLESACAKRGARLCCPELALCTDNGAMIAFAAALKISAGGLTQGEEQSQSLLPRHAFSVRPRWPLGTV
jgi:N6-L-threonylcarbamoyladenine synthase